MSDLEAFCEAAREAEPCRVFQDEMKRSLERFNTRAFLEQKRFSRRSKFPVSLKRKTESVFFQRYLVLSFSLETRNCKSTASSSGKMSSENSEPSLSPGDEDSLDPAIFYELKSIRTLRSHQIFLNDSPDKPLYTIKATEAFSRRKYDINLYSGPDANSPIVGVVKMHFQYVRKHTLGIGDPNALLEEGGSCPTMIWEELRRMDQWVFKRYSFEFEGKGERKTYTWRLRMTGKGLKKLRCMELREGGVECVDGEVIAAWRGNSPLRFKSGSLFIKKGVYGERDKGEGKQWELMVLLSAITMTEGAVRRSK